MTPARVLYALGPAGAIMCMIQLAQPAIYLSLIQRCLRSVHAIRKSRQLTAWIVSPLSTQPSYTPIPRVASRDIWLQLLALQCAH